MVSSRGSENSFGAMVHFIKASSRMDSWKVMESNSFQMEASSSESLGKTSSMVRERTYRREDNTKGDSSTTKDRARELIDSRMAGYTRESSKEIDKTEEAECLFQMGS